MRGDAGGRCGEMRGDGARTCTLHACGGRGGLRVGSEMMRWTEVSVRATVLTPSITDIMFWPLLDAVVSSAMVRACMSLTCVGRRGRAGARRARARACAGARASCEQWEGMGGMGAWSNRRVIDPARPLTADVSWVRSLWLSRAVRCALLVSNWSLRRRGGARWRREEACARAASARRVHMR